MLKEFDVAFKDFERDAYSLLYECHFDAGKDLPSFKVQTQAQGIATDIGYLSMVMRDLHRAAIEEVSNEMDRENAEYQSYLKQRIEEVGPSLVLDDEFFRNQPRRERSISIALAKFGAAFKAFLFPIRGYQDAIYKVGLRIVGQPVGGKSSMARAVNEATHSFVSENPVGKILETDIPEYPAWFLSLRNQRTFIKYGAGVSYSSGKSFVTGETTIAINLHTRAENQPSISLDDVSQALRMSTKATMAIVKYGIAHGKLNQRARKSET
jgi:hypothetical protein